MTRKENKMMKSRENMRGQGFLWGLWVLGVVLTALAHTRWNLGILAWVAPVPFLMALRHTSGWKSRLWVGSGLWLGWALAMMKLTTAPMPLGLAVVFGTPIAFFLFPGYLVWDRLRKSLSPHAAILSFAGTSVVGEWLQHSFTPFASWGAAAYTQVNAAEWMQVTSLFGMAGLSFLLYWTAAGVEMTLSSRRVFKVHSYIWASVLLCCWTYGSLRISIHSHQSKETTLVAAVSTDATFSPERFPSAEKLEAIRKSLFERTQSAAKSGAKIVVWNEGSTMIVPKKDKAWKASLQELARRAKIHLVAAYVVPTRLKPMLYENKFLWIDPSGKVLQEYFKHKPVFGEPAVAGTKPHRAIHTSFGKVAGAICYDYDFPSIGRAHTALNIGLAVVPSSDWLGIHGYHTQMALMRSIEGGYSLLRSTRLGLSAGYDPYGTPLAQQSFFDKTNKIMLVALPTRPVFTLYSVVGDIVVWFSFVALCVAMLMSLGVLGSLKNEG